MIAQLKDRLQRVLGLSRVRRASRRGNRLLFGALTHNRAVATVALALTPLGFNRERYAVLRGRARYFANLDLVEGTNVVLRRNTHRLEKALIMEPRRERFALDYIGETVDAFEASAAAATADPGELRWARDVLAVYFDAVDRDDTLDDLARRYKAACAELDATWTAEDRLRAPFSRGESPQPTISHQQLLDLSLRRRSVRWFEPRPVPRELIDQAMLVARQSPSACNRQPFEYRFFDDPELVRQVAAIPFGAAGYGHNIPTIAVLVGRHDHFFSARDRHVIYIDTALSAMAFMFALETLGLSSSAINWPDFEPLELRMQRTLGLDPAERVIMLMAIGYGRADGGVPFSEKKSLDALRSFNRWPDRP